MDINKLIDYTNYTEKCNPRTAEISRITPHCYVGQVTAKQGADYLANTSREASANLIIGYDGSVACNVPLGKRAWTSGSEYNDSRAITIEIACEPVHPYSITDAAMDKLIEVMAALVDTYPGLGGKLEWKNDPNDIGNITVHRWFQATACPGDYLMEHMGYIADMANDMLGVESTPEKPAKEDPKPAPTGGSIDDAVKAIWYGPNPYGNGEDRKTNLRNAGYSESDIAEIQRRINAGEIESGTAPAPQPSGNSIDAAVQAIYYGPNPYGNGQDRVNGLRNAGYSDADIAEIQRRLNEGEYGNTGSTPAPQPTDSGLSIQDAVNAIWYGPNPYGTGADRVTNLRNAGYSDSDIAEIQRRLNAGEY